MAYSGAQQVILSPPQLTPVGNYIFITVTAGQTIIITDYSLSSTANTFTVQDAAGIILATLTGTQSTGVINSFTILTTGANLQAIVSGGSSTVEGFIKYFID